MWNVGPGPRCGHGLPLADRSSTSRTLNDPLPETVTAKIAHLENHLHMSLGDIAVAGRPATLSLESVPLDRYIGFRKEMTTITQGH